MSKWGGIGGGIVGNQFDNKRVEKDAESVQLYTVPLLEVLQRHEAPPVIDYLSLDVEGAEFLIMKEAGG